MTQPLPIDGSVPAPATYRQVMAVPEFRVVLLAEILAILGQVAVQITLSVLIYQRTGSPLLSSLAFALGFVPYLLGATLLSAVADRFPTRPVLVLTQSVSAAVMACMAVPGTPVPVLLLLLLATGTIAPVFQGTRAAALPDVLAGDGYPLGRSLLRMAAQTAQIAGFALGGALLLVVSTTTALLVAAGAMAASAVILRAGTRLRPARRRTSGPSASVARESLSGVAEVLRLPRLRPLLVLTWLAPALAIAPEALAAPLSASIGAGSAGVGLLLSAAPIGMIAGELLAGSLLPGSVRVRFMVPMALVVFAPMPLFWAEPGLAVSVALLMLCGTGFAHTLGLDRLVLAATPDELRGRALTVVSAGMMITQGLGFAAAGAAAEFAPPHLVIVGAGVCGLAVVLLSGRAARRHRTQGTASPRDEWIRRARRAR
ncbi:putative MFS family arabinose efflux permease [Spinactinospora alkalitolerans]|uniref:Putative MFS family arabinose efflux permease n=1 Tax=Spinactinospora alkalitolerans TaxID=687207 RepID=A0A852TTW1_9ACTN|nr:MFS transporter [Spinactinospora alkalitolerans]NYE47469.1 putative MFS family arabinose efflux permease [Spinactinospora alkalitolerans]